MATVFFEARGSKRQRDQKFLEEIAHRGDPFRARQYYAKAEQPPAYCIEGDTDEKKDGFASLDDHKAQKCQAPPSEELTDD